MRKHSLVDSHCHLDFRNYSYDLEQVITRARQEGVSGFLTISTCINNLQKVLKVSENHEDVWCTVGLHPQEVENERPITASQLGQLTRHPKIIGLGETGLDYSYKNYSVLSQQNSFRTHITAAREVNLPLVIHNREADDDMITILKEERAIGPFNGILHCFNSGPQLANLAVELGLLISISGIITFHKVNTLEAIIYNLPLNHLLVETDAPFLAPTPQRGSRNEPAFTIYTAKRVSELRKLSLSELANITTCNFLRMFKKINSKQCE